MLYTVRALRRCFKNLYCSCKITALPFIVVVRLGGGQTSEPYGKLELRSVPHSKSHSFIIVIVPGTQRALAAWWLQNSTFNFWT